LEEWPFKGPTFFTLSSLFSALPWATIPIIPLSVLEPLLSTPHPSALKKEVGGFSETLVDIYQAVDNLNMCRDGRMLSRR
jgi:hypothetical protein